jgi:predicted nucleic acid-binding protein
MSATRATYLDASALVKLAYREPGSAALNAYLRRRPVRVSSVIVRTEVIRALAPYGADRLRRGREVLAKLALMRVNDRVLDAAGVIPPIELRSLDAIHLATAEQLEDELGTFVTYDERLAAAATARGMKVAQPR